MTRSDTWLTPQVFFRHEWQKEISSDFRRNPTVPQTTIIKGQAVEEKAIYTSKDLGRKQIDF